METASVRCELQGLSALLMHRWPEEEIENPEKLPGEEQAEMAAYRVPNTGDPAELYVPAEALRQSLIGAGLYSKGKGRASLQKAVAACVQVEPDYLTLGTSEYVVDMRLVVIPSTKGRVKRYRPRLDEWKITATLIWEPVLITEAQLRTVVDNAGRRVGLLDFRPACKGPMGRFTVTSWQPE